MPVKIEGCCDGTGENCRRWSCPLYSEAEPIARQRKGPRIPTGYGDANPVHESDILLVVKEKYKNAQKARSVKPEDRNVI